MDDDSNVPVVVDDIDDVCSCDSIYHSLIDTMGGAQPLATAPASDSPVQGQGTFSVPEPDSLALKDQRSNQRARQQLKKSDDVSKAKRCVRCRWCRPWKWAGNAGRPKEGSRGLRAEYTEGKGESKRMLEDSVDWTETEHVVPKPPMRTVSLADLVKAPRKGSEKQFEMIGRPRQVLVLDEFTEIDSGKLDLEDWEHIEFEVKHRKAMSMAPSYARVVASRA